MAIAARQDQAVARYKKCHRRAFAQEEHTRTYLSTVYGLQTRLVLAQPEQQGESRLAFCSLWIGIRAYLKLDISWCQAVGTMQFHDIMCYRAPRHDRKQFLANISSLLLLLLLVRIGIPAS